MEYVYVMCIYSYMLGFSNGPTRHTNLENITCNMAMDVLKTFYTHHPYIKDLVTHSCTAPKFTVLSCIMDAVIIFSEEFSMHFCHLYLFCQTAAKKPHTPSKSHYTKEWGEEEE